MQTSFTPFVSHLVFITEWRERDNEDPIVCPCELVSYNYYKCWPLFASDEYNFHQMLFLLPIYIGVYGVDKFTPP